MRKMSAGVVPDVNLRNPYTQAKKHTSEADIIKKMQNRGVRGPKKIDEEEFYYW